MRITASGSAVPLILARLLPAFAARYPMVEVDIGVDDHFVDIVSGSTTPVFGSAKRSIATWRTSVCRRRAASWLPARRRTSNEPFAWELERGKRNWHVPVRGPVITNDAALRLAMAVSGVGLIYTLEPLLKGASACVSSSSRVSAGRAPGPGGT